MVNASLKSARSLIGPVFPELLREIHHFFLNRKYSACVLSIGEIFQRKFVLLDADFFSSIMFELRLTKFSIFQEAIVNPFKMPLDASLSQIMGNLIVFLFFRFPISVAMRSSLLNDIILN